MFNSKSLFISIIFIVFIFIVSTVSVYAANITVTGACTLPDAITAANTDAASGSCAAGSGADTIILSGNITLTATLPQITSDITIEGGGFTLDGNGNGSVLYNNGNTLTINNLTITGGTGDSGNGAGSGCSVTANCGGGIFNELGTVIINNSTISGNDSGLGGGIFNDLGDTVTISNSTISGNTSALGGGIHNDIGGTVTISNSMISGNATVTLGGGTGGGISNEGGTVTISNSTISGNSTFGSSVAFGGGIANFGDGTVIISNSTISGNSSPRGGGGIASFGGVLTISNSTISGNSATGLGGGGIWEDSSLVTINNSLITNSLSGGNCVGVDLSGGNNLSDDATCVVAQDNSINLGGLADNGGPTETHALLAGSSAIDGSSGGTASDQRGAAAVGTRDIGAYEYLGVVPTIAFTVDLTSITEGGTATVTVTPSNHTAGGDITVQFAISGTATLATDYTLAGLGTNNTLTFPANTAQTFTISSLTDMLIEGNETVILDMSLFSGAADIAGTTPQTVTIVDLQTDLEITKTDGVTSVAQGGALTYTIVVSNNGPGDDPNVTVADTFPASLTGVTYTSVVALGATGNTASGSGNLSDTLNMPSGSSVTYTISATVDAMATGTISNTATATGSITDPNAVNNSATDADTLITQVPIFSKAFSPNVIALNATSTLTFTIDNTANALVVTNLNFTDNLPAGSVIASPSNASTTCTGGTITAVAASGVISYAGGSVPASASCTITVDVTSATAASYVNTTGDLTSSSGNSGTASDTLIVVPAPTFTKSFSPDPIALNGTSTLTFTIDNTGSALAATSLDFTDNLPAGLVIATPSNAATTCTGGTLTATSGAGVVTYAGGTAPASASCTVSVDVTSSIAATYVNTTGDLTSSSGNSGTASDTLTVADELAIGKEFTNDPIFTTGGTVTLEFTILNPDINNAVSAIAFTDDLTAVLTGLIAITENSNTCGGTVTLGTTISFAGGSLAVNSSCTISLSLTVAAGSVAGTYANTTSSLSNANCRI